MNSDGLAGFYYSHDGHWNAKPTNKGEKTKVECANTCLRDCVAISYSTNPADNCYHYNDEYGLVRAEKITDDRMKSYVKCSGTTNIGYCLVLGMKLLIYRLKEK